MACKKEKPCSEQTARQDGNITNANTKGNNSLEAYVNTTAIEKQGANSKIVDFPEFPGDDGMDMDSMNKAYEDYCEVEEERKGKKKKHLSLDGLETEMSKMGLGLKFNIISNELIVVDDKYNGKEHKSCLKSGLPAILYSELGKKYADCTMSTIKAYLPVLAGRNRYNPVWDLISSTQWDGEDHVGKIYAILGIDEHDTLSRTLVLKWLWQGLALLHNNEHEQFGADGVLVLSGSQGIGKTSFFRKMAILPKFFGEGEKLNSLDKDFQRRVVTVWIAELGELGGTTSRTDANDLKNFITTAFDRYRLPYAATDEEVPRHTNLCGTVNDKEFLVDETGNRRFWTVPITRIDLNALEAMTTEQVTQVWSQVWEQYASKNLQGFRLTIEERNALDARNVGFGKRLKGEQEVLDCLSLPYDRMGLMTATEFIGKHDCLKRYTSSDVGKVLAKHGYTVETTTRYGKRGRYYRLPVPGALDCVNGNADKDNGNVTGNVTGTR